MANLLVGLSCFTHSAQTRQASHTLHSSLEEWMARSGILTSVFEDTQIDRWHQP